MYYEFIDFCKQVSSKESYFRDGDLWTSVVGGAVSFGLFLYDGEPAAMFQAHLGDLLIAASVVFITAVFTLFHFIDEAVMWSDCKNVQNVGRMMIDRYTWTALCFLFLMGGVFCVSILGGYISRVYWLDCFVHSCLVFGFLYFGCQIFDNILTVWWYFRSRNRFINPEED